MRRVVVCLCLGASSLAGAWNEPFRPWLAGGSVAVDPVKGEVFVAESAAGVIAVATAGARKLERTITVGGGPEQVVVGPDGAAFVSLREAGEVVAIAPGGTEVAARVQVGREPFGLALSPAGDLLFVTLAGSAELVALDPKGLAERFRVHVDPEPRAVAALSDGSNVVVSHLLGETISVLELGTLPAPPTRIRLATFEEERFGPHDRPRQHVANLAYAIAPAPDRRRIYVPHAVEDTGAGIVPERRAGTYGAGTPEPVLPAVSAVDIDAEVAFPDRRVGAWRSGPSFGPGKSSCLSRMSQPRAAVVDPSDHRRLFVAGLGSDEVSGFDLSSQPNDHAFCIDFARGSGPKGVAISSDGAWLYVHLGFTHKLAAVRVGAPIDDHRHQLHVRTLTVGHETMPAAAVRGRRIFYSAGDDRQSSNGNLPCATCHPEGRHDGLVWRLDQGPRQTPILAGRLTGTAPYNWRGTGDTLVHNFSDTVKRLGGKGLTPRDLGDLELFTTRYLGRAPSRAQAAAPPLVERGRALFASDDVGCAHCHDPARHFTDGRTHDIGTMNAEERKPGQARLAYKTPSLVGVSASAPYFHDGSAPNLRALIAGNADDRMGRTAQLSPVEVDALVAYLGTL